MPVLFNNKPITEDDKKAIKDMLSMSMDTLAKSFEDDAREKPEKYPADAYNLIAQKMREAVENFDTYIDRAIKDKKNLTVTQFIEEFMSDTVATMANGLGEVEFNDRTYKSIQLRVRELGYKPLIDVFQMDVFPRDTDEGYNLSESTFELPTEPIEGIEDIEEYDPASDNIRSLYGGRSGNSSTLGVTVEKLKEERKKAPNDPDTQARYDRAIDEAYRSAAGFHMCAETARMHSVELKRKDEVTFADLYNTFIDLNKNARLGDDTGGRFRDGFITAGNIRGTGAMLTPKYLTKTLTKIAECMNAIKKEPNEALRKTQAIRLAAYAFSMTLSEHVFEDANGRTCRMFADTILQTFGLPPHIPSKEELTLTKTIGECAMDFKKGSNVFFDCIKKSSDILKEEREAFMQTPEYRMQLEGRVKDLNTVVKNIALEADKKLKLLETMTKKGHKNGDDYNKMHDALEKLAQMRPENVTIEQLNSYLGTLDRTSRKYETSHTGWFVATKGYGEDRFNMSRELQEFAKERTDHLASFSKGFDRTKKVSEFTADDLDKGNRLERQNQNNAPQAEQPLQQRKRSNSISFKDLKKQENVVNAPQNNNNSAPKKRNSINASKPANKSIKNGP